MIQATTTRQLTLQKFIIRDLRQLQLLINKDDLRMANLLYPRINKVANNCNLALKRLRSAYFIIDTMALSLCA